jgi:3-methylcrotonyl-CoA carboxylase alpha subunit
VQARGHAIEARLYAEDPARGFLPSIGRIAHWRMPPCDSRVRVDTGFRAGDEVSPFYDPMLAKLIVWGEDRERARVRLLDALGRCEVAGVATNLALLERIVAHPDFAAGAVDTGLIERRRDALLAPRAPDDRAFAVAALAEYAHILRERDAAAMASPDRWSPWNAADAWWNGTSSHAIHLTFAGDAETRAMAVKPLPDGQVALESGGRCVTAAVLDDGERLHVRLDGARADYAVVRDGRTRHLFGNGLRASLALVDPLAHARAAPAHAGHLMAPMSGTIVAVLVKPGDRVEQDAPLVVLEAMKMEHTIAAPSAGVVSAVNCAVGERVAEGTDLVDVDAAPP